ncbi:MAG: ribosome silencing factor [Candidatus Sericytochromatia bacterium]|nr:ribosome silencing factor [Candidatus Sericytochromatia bacterium]
MADALDSRPLVELAAHKADDKKADDIRIFNLDGVSLLADYILLCSGQTTVKVRAIAQHIEEELTKAGHKLYGSEGWSEAVWILLDFGTVIVHVMRSQEREFYNLERLYGSCPSEAWVSPTPAS